MKDGKSAIDRQFGDFQTPLDLARMVCNLLYKQGVRPVSILEPTCGWGNFLLAAFDTFDSVRKAIGMDINPEYVNYVSQKLGSKHLSGLTEVRQSDFFDTDWENILDDLPEPVLVIGNPPWITSSELTKLEGQNLPRKANFRNFSGLDAVTGKSNFDISEWMLIQLLNALANRNATLAMLCKTAVARKVLFYLWSKNFHFRETSMYLIDAKRFFSASVSACLLVCRIGSAPGSAQCEVYVGLDQQTYQTTFALLDGQMVANRDNYERWKHLIGSEYYKWRSGIKHDCQKVMELTRDGQRYRNGLGEVIDLEDTHVFPMLKSADMKDSPPVPRKWMLVPQLSIGEPTHSLRRIAPKTWEYLQKHRTLLENRRSAIYRNRPAFSVFGVGKYSFALWKVAISGLYKRLHFAVVGPYAGRPVVLDDTCYFIACQTEEEAEHLAGLLNSEIARQFFEAFVFWDDKRPITLEVLSKLDLLALARELGSEQVIRQFLQLAAPDSPKYEQLALLGSC